MDAILEECSKRLLNKGLGPGIHNIYIELVEMREEYRDVGFHAGITTPDDHKTWTFLTVLITQLASSREIRML